jgi:hypothetical protein
MKLGTLQELADRIGCGLTLAGAIKQKSGITKRGRFDIDHVFNYFVKHPNTKISDTWKRKPKSLLCSPTGPKGSTACKPPASS